MGVASKMRVKSSDEPVNRQEGAITTLSSHKRYDLLVLVYLACAVAVVLTVSKKTRKCARTRLVKVGERTAKSQLLDRKSVV